MGKLLAYSIVSGLIMLAMYLAYKLFISRENQHNFNRGILLLIYFVSFSAYPIYNYIDGLTEEHAGASIISNVEVGDLSLKMSGQPAWSTFLIWTFLIGVAIVTLKTIIVWFKIIKVIRSGEKIRKDGYTLVVIEDDKVAPFSWMDYVVINRTDYEADASAIIIHELKHVRSFHRVDLLIARIVCILNWFNPVAWLMRDEVMLVHEYQADMAVIDSGHSRQEYQMLLIKKAVGARFPSLANSINHSKLKKRITMMYKSKRGASGRLKALALVPMVALALSVTTVPAVEAAVSTIGHSNLSLGKGSENSLDSTQFSITSLNNSGVETTVVIRGEGLGEYISVSDVSFTNKGNDYSAKALNTTMTDGCATIKAVFPLSDNYENASVAFMLNGQKVTLQLDDFHGGSQTSAVSISPSNGIVISQGNATLSTVGDMEIYLDGKKISEEEMKELNPETIASMSIDKQTNKIFITSK
ncbi:MAG: M56 family metallopeptidase [Muribaculaceae bacterium]|nr:M56 family metallopeptidase [Muribaculaceae bacterium]